ncbi:MAG: amidohydrolase [Saprospiraceae bacterium]|nr:amidohydrolase [Saprospiraceae bacterium]
MVLAFSPSRLDRSSRYLPFAFWALFTFPLQGQTQQVADVLLTNGQIYTMAAARNKVQALAIKEDQIIFTGSDQSAQAFLGPTTKLIDLQNRMVLPGFTDAHIHPISGGTRLMNCDLTDLRTAEEVLKKLNSYVSTHPEKEWIIGGGLWLPAIENGQPSAKTLDKIVQDKPVYITSADGHSAWVNSKALEIGGVTANTEDPNNGVIERFADGSPIGTLRESAMSLVSKHIPPTSAAEQIAALHKAQNLAHQYGITAWIDASVGAAGIEAYLALEEAGELQLDIDVSITARVTKAAKALPDILALYEKYQPQSQNIQMKSAKIFIDGVVEGKTAALFENYVGESHKGLAYLGQQPYNEMIAAFDKAGIQVHVHACGDKGVHMTLNAFEYARQQNKVRDARHHIVHMQLMHPDDIDRFRQLDVIANIQPLWATPEDTYISELTIPVVGPERTEWIYPFGAIAESGAVIAHGSDWPVTTMNPFHAIQVAVTRRGPDEIERPAWTPQHLMDLYTVLNGYTQGGAFLMHREDSSGSLAAGKKANLMILNQDLFAIPKTAIHKTEVLLTFYQGDIVYQHDKWNP